MNRLIVTAILATPFLIAAQVHACGYGLFDADVELFCSGDPLQSQQAWARLMKRGPQAAAAVRSYYAMAQRQERNTREMLARLQRGEDLGLSREQAAKEIVRLGDFLKYNRQRMAKLQRLLVYVTGDLLGGEPWGAERLSVA